MKTLLRFPLLLALIFAIVQHASSNVKLPRIFSSNMVLQQGIDIPVWGWADKGEQVLVEFNGITVRTVCGKSGKWMVKLPVQQYGGPYKLIVTGKNEVVFDNVMVGEVWICSGQSNMQWRVDQSKNAEEEVSEASYPNIRLFSVPRKVAQFPDDDISGGEWVECSPETVKGFSAVGYFFGRDIHNNNQVPVGLIHTSWGGTVAETWISPQSIANDPDFKAPMKELQQMDMEKYQAEKIENLRKRLGDSMPEKAENFINKKAIWSASDFNDERWTLLKTPGYWEEMGYKKIDGIAWYRTKIMLTSEQAAEKITLHLGRIDDSDITYFNGVEVGHTEFYNEERIYTVDPQLIKEGENTIAIRVEDTGGSGGFWGNPSDFYLTTGNEKIKFPDNWKFKFSKVNITSINFDPNDYPTLLFNAMINPLIPYAIKGAIWYQGESNAGRAKQYRRVFPMLIKDWREKWNEGEFPFLFVSLANYMQPVAQPSESTWAELRDAQTSALKLPNTGMAMAIDIGEADDIHPKNKQDVGHRLALNAFKIAYGKNIVNSGPMYQSVSFKNGKAYITFSNKGTGIISKNKYGYINGFSIAGDDRKFVWAKADLLDDGTVVVYADGVDNPVAVRYGWANNPDDLNLYNKEGLPAIPFKTDDWPGITK